LIAGADDIFKTAVWTSRLGDRTYRRICSLLDVARDESGTTAIEFAILAPVLCLLLIGIIQTSIVMNNWVELNYGVRAASRVLAQGRGSATPYTSAQTVLFNAATNLTSSSITFTVSVAGASCAADSGCSTALTAAVGGSLVVTASYPCDMTIMGVNYAPGCTIQTQTTERVE
jgi:Flp pilus assembly protein TadG